jgi:cytochrome c553
MVAVGQTYTGNSKNGLAGYDVLGAHNNGGRGCAGCHAPHSGAAGGGGNAATNAGAFNDPLSGTSALFGQDVTPLFTQTLVFGNGYTEVTPSEAAAYTTNTEELRGIMMCLACHDGVIAKGQMMAGSSWEQSTGLLPAGVYGTRPIPTLLGNDNGNGNTSGYGNDHPVGTQATLGKLRLVSANGGKATDALTVTVVNGAISNIAPLNATYTAFAANYGYPAIAGSAWSWGVALPDGATDGSKAFLTCTTCHNQHVMYIYQAPGGGKQAGSAIAGGTFPTYFFVNAPYNPGSGNTDPKLAASATQFCRQCHIGEANETFGVNSVKTQF